MDFKPKLVAFDLDGTLAESKQRVTPDMGELLGALLHNMPVAVMSGAGFPQFEKQFFPALPNDAKLENLYIFPTNAAQCYVYKNGGWVRRYDESFTKEQRERILSTLKTTLAQTGLDHIPEKIWGEQVEDRGAQITFSALGQEAPVEEKQKWDPTRAKRRPLYDTLVQKLPDFSIGLNATTSIDITQKGVNKAYGVRQLAGISGVPVSEMLYVGDALSNGGNDSVVIETGIKTEAVVGPKETTKVIERILSQFLVI